MPEPLALAHIRTQQGLSAAAAAVAVALCLPAAAAAKIHLISHTATASSPLRHALEQRPATQANPMSLVLLPNLL